MSLIPHTKCDVCHQEILDDALPHQTRLEFERQIDKDNTLVLDRRDICDGCSLRIEQVILAHLPNCAWILDGFKVVRK